MNPFYFSPAMRYLQSIALVVGLSSLAHADDGRVTYERDIRPILQRHCVGCHQQDNLAEREVSGNLALDSFDGVMSGVEQAPPRKIVVPGKSGKSKLLEMLLTEDETLRMPLDAEALPAEEIDLIRRWIDQGAERGDPVSEPAAPRRKRAPRTIDVLLSVGATLPDRLRGGGNEKLQMVLPIGPLSPVTAVAYRPDGKALAVAGHGRVSLWDVGAGAIVAQHTTELTVHDVAFSPDGALLAVAGGLAARKGTVLLLGGRDLSEVNRIEGHRDIVFAVAFSPNGERLASGSFDKTVRLWDVASTEPLASAESHSDFVYDVAFTPDGRRVASASKDRTIKLIDLQGQSQRTLSGHEQDVLAVALTADGKFAVSAGLEPALRWWNLEDGTPVRQVGGHGGPVHDIVLSADGKQFATASADKTIRLWDSASGALVKTFTAGGEWLYCVAISPDGRQVVGGTWDGLVHIWSVERGTLTATLVEPARSGGRSDYLVLTSAGYYEASPGMNDLLCWRLAGNEPDDPTMTAALQRPDEVRRALAGEPVETVTLGR